MSGRTPQDGETNPNRSDPAPYGGDYYRWTLDQAALIRSGAIEQLDRTLVADEIEDLGKSEYAALESDLTVILHHVLKWDHQPDRRSRSWELSIREHRRRVARRLKASPSFRSRLAEAMITAFEDGRDRALSETNLPDNAIPTECPYSWTDVTARAFQIE